MTAVVFPDQTNESDPIARVLRAYEASAKYSGRSMIPAIIVAILALPIGVLVGPYGPFVWFFSVVVLSQLLLVAIHELGHLAAAWVAEFYIALIMIGPLAVRRHGNTFRIAHNRSKGIGGYVAAVPEDPDNQRGWLIAYFAAGAIANLVGGAVAFVGYLITPTTLLGYALLLPFAVFSVVIAFLSLIPVRVGAFSSDGRMILNLLRRGPDSEHARASWRLLSFARQTRRPREWDPETIDIVLSKSDGSMFEAGSSYMAYLHHLDAGREDEAACFMERSVTNLGRVPLLISTEYFVEATFFYVRRGSNPTLAREILTRIGPQYGDELSRLRAEAAVHLAEGQAHFAIQTARRAIALADDDPGLGITMFERDLASSLLAAAEASESRSHATSRSASRSDDYVAVSPTA